jgi:hypothetical protein
MSIFDIFKRKEGPSVFSGGDGSSFERAVIINCDNSIAGVQAEYAFLASRCGEPRRDWNVHGQSLQEHDGRPHDVIVVALASGEMRTFHFDIGKFFGKL